MSVQSGLTQTTVTPIRRRNMQANKRRDSRPERALRSLLHATGLRYRCDFRIRIEGKWVRPDIVFTKRKIAVFVDGCFWHACPLHGREPQTNSEYWGPKLRHNRERDERDTDLLKSAGWHVIRVWEHDSPVEAHEQVLRVWTARSPVIRNAESAELGP